MLRFRKVTSVHVKIEKLFPALATSNFQGVFVNKFDSKVKLIWSKMRFSEEIYSKTKRIYNKRDLQQNKKKRGGGRIFWILVFALLCHIDWDQLPSTPTYSCNLLYVAWFIFLTEN